MFVAAPFGGSDPNNPISARPSWNKTKHSLLNKQKSYITLFLHETNMHHAPPRTPAILRCYIFNRYTLNKCKFSVGGSLVFSTTNPLHPNFLILICRAMRYFRMHWNNTGACHDQSNSKYDTSDGRNKTANMQTIQSNYATANTHTIQHANISQSICWSTCSTRRAVCHWFLFSNISKKVKTKHWCRA